MKEIEKTLKNVLIELMSVELEFAVNKFGAFNSPHEAYGVMREELDEAWDAIKKNDFEHAERELLQVAAMCIRFGIDRRIGFSFNGKRRS